jgi:predicted O-linked N-acetylglucosamine transferase (SPINDLY family)
VKGKNKLDAGTIALLQKAGHEFQQGRLDDAAAYIQKILTLDKTQPDANHMMGLIAYRRKQYDSASELISRAIKINPYQPVFHFNLGLVMQGMRKQADALVSYDRTIQINPAFIEAHLNRGNVLKDMGRTEDALTAYDRVIEINQAHAKAHSNRSNALKDLGRLEEGLAAAERSIQLNSTSPEAYNIRGCILKDLGRMEDALADFNRAIQIDPQIIDAHANRGIILLGQGNYLAALAACARVIQLNPGAAEAHNSRGNILFEAGHLNDALTAFENALNTDPQSANAHRNRGFILPEQRHLVEALETYAKAIQLDPGLAYTCNTLGTILWYLDQVEEAESSYRRALKLKPDLTIAHSNLLFFLEATLRMSPDEALIEQKMWDQEQGKAGRLYPMPAYRNEITTDRRLRIGYVSPDFRTHAVSYFFEPLIAAHDHSCFEIFCYDANKTGPDETTMSLRDAADHWREVAGVSDEKLANIIHEDKIDILVDLTGHTAGNRLKTFTYKPAPIQATYLGFFAATGLEAMDYWITDETLHPPDTPERSVEQIYRLPRCSFCYKPSSATPAVAPCQNTDEKVVLGSFNHMSKLTSDVIKTWSTLIHKLPGSILLLHEKSLGNPDNKEILLERFAEHDVSPEQLLIHGNVSMGDYLSTYARVDIALDPFPRTGATTTAEALWMGVPVVTLAGQHYMERASASMLTAIGLNDLIASSCNEYISTVIALARDPERRSYLRNNLRSMMANSPLCDAKDLAFAMEAAYQKMWEQYVDEFD